MSGQNTSMAVMQNRSDAPEGLDYFPTPPWGTRALCEHLATYGAIERDTVWEPACGEGYMARPLAEYFRQVTSSDIHDYGHGAVYDFLADGTLLDQDPPIDFRHHKHQPDWIITNPPFNKAEDFALRGLEVAREGVALLVRTAFLEGGGRYKRLFEPRPPEWILQFCERVPMLKGRLDRQASSATSYCWIVWVQPVYRSRHGFQGPAFDWIPPCRKRLEKLADYEPQEAKAQ
ncbi:class I SAM-dependent methyltransferase [Fodinicurvata fenggangensis]|uniref:class I SAM-dependent methyltransferase n=1 Tax=Fodinicurvata fenggangensis TaxID=1121830 RepID=UPI0004790BFE|nr:class I SAM-dependent methyltransferase [Fodinicurvata fenggangensis]